MTQSVTYDGRLNSPTANNNELNLLNETNVFSDFYFFTDGNNDGVEDVEGELMPGDLILEANDTDTKISIDLDGDGTNEVYSINFQSAGVLPAIQDDPNTPEDETLADPGDKVPDAFHEVLVYKVEIVVPGGDNVVIVFSPGGEITAADWSISKNDPNGFAESNITLGQIDNNPQPVCFVFGSLLQTSKGAVAVQLIKEGDILVSRDGSKAEVLWAGSRKVSLTEQLLVPGTRPVCIPAGALGNGTPTTDLWVSPQHRVLVQGHLAETLFGAPEVLVAAKHLDFGDLAKGKKRPAEVEYFHILLDKHDVLIANGAPAESLFLGDQAQTMLSDESLAEIEVQFPREQHPEMWTGEVAAPTLTAAEGAVLSQALRRDLQNAKPADAAA